MKNLIYISALVLLTMLVLQGCKKDFVEGYDIDPNKPLDVSMDVLLSSAQAHTTWVSSSDLARLTNVIMQQMTGEDRQFLAINRYVIASSDVENVWEYNAYAGGMKDLAVLMDKANDESSPHYGGVAKILMAFNLGTLSDAFGDIPYSEALNGTIDSDLEPGYDSQQQIFQTIIALLDDGMDDVNAATSLLSPGGDDIYLGGDMAMWSKFASSLKARYLNHISSTANYDADIMAAAATGFGAGEGTLPVFEASKPQSNPWNQFLIVDRDGYIGLSGHMFDGMDANNDTLRAVEFGIDGFYFGSTSPVVLMHDNELLFIQAETMLRMGESDGDIQAKLVEAVASHFSMIGVSSADYIADDLVDLSSLANADEKLEAIMWEKYVASYTTNEAWADYRRTGYPDITPVDNAQGDIGIPSRLPYPQSEYLYNSNAPSALESFPANMTTPVWWAQ